MTAPALVVCVCGGKQRMALVSVQGMRAAGIVRCPHCQEHPRDSIEIKTLRMYRDIPRDHKDEIA